MARIAFFSERLPPQSADPIAEFSYDLMCNLADQQHEVRVFSTYRPLDEAPPAHPRVEIIRPFKKWGWLEIPKLIPLLLEFQPDVLHFIQPHAEAMTGVTNAMSALPGLSSVLGRPAIVSSFYDLNQRSLAAHKQLLSMSNVITVMNDLQKELLTDYIQKFGSTAFIKVLPVPIQVERDAISSSENEEPHSAFTSDSLARFFSLHQKVVCVPGDLNQHEDLVQLFETLIEALKKYPEAAVLFAGQWGEVPMIQRRELMHMFVAHDLGSRVLMTGPLSPREERFCLSRSTLVFTASLPAESLNLSRFVREALKASAPLVLSVRQAEITPLSWNHGEQAFIANDIFNALLEALASDAKLKQVRQSLPEFTRFESSDQPGNAMSRIYARLLDEKRRHP